MQTMNTEIHVNPAPLSTKFLASLSACLFWCVPFSPLLLIAAIKATNNTAGWPRQVARTAAILTIAWVAYLTVAVAWAIYVIVWNPALA